MRAELLEHDRGFDGAAPNPPARAGTSIPKTPISASARQPRVDRPRFASADVVDGEVLLTERADRVAERSLLVVEAEVHAREATPAREEISKRIAYDALRLTCKHANEGKPSTMTRDFDLLDGRWYASNAVRGLGMDAGACARVLGRQERGLGDHALRRRARSREGRGHVLEPPRAAAARQPSPDDDLDGRSRALATPQAREPAASRRSACATTKPTIRRICTAIIDRVAPNGECDFVWDIAAPLPLLLIAEMLGFPPDCYDDLLRWSDDLIRGTTVDPPPEVVQARRWTRARVPRVPAGGHRRPPVEVAAGRPRQHPLPRRDRRRAARRRVDHPGEPAHPHRRRRDDAGTSSPTGCSRSWSIPISSQLLRDDPSTIADRCRGAAALGVADQEHGAHRDARRRAARRDAARGSTSSS